MLIRRPEDRKAGEQAHVDALRGIDASFTEALDLAEEFAQMARKTAPPSLTGWFSRAEQSACTEMRGLAQSLRGDEAAVAAALAEKWSNGPVEGHVNRLKAIKRQMYGRAGFELLRSRVLNAA